MSEPEEILSTVFKQSTTQLGLSFIADEEIRYQIEYVSNNLKNRAGVRFLMACLLAKIHQPAIDIRKPYTAIGDHDVFSGRTYDEQYITPFINRYNLPCNNTTAFLTPALRNRNMTLTKDINLLGNPPQLYQFVLKLLDAIYTNKVLANDMLLEIIRCLIIIKNERQQRLDLLIKALKATVDSIPLSSEEIVNLLEQHLKLKGTSRLPVLMIAAAYQAAEKNLGELEKNTLEERADYLNVLFQAGVPVILWTREMNLPIISIENEQITDCILSEKTLPEYLRKAQ